MKITRLLTITDWLIALWWSINYDPIEKLCGISSHEAKILYSFFLLNTSDIFLSIATDVACCVGQLFPILVGLIVNNASQCQLACLLWANCSSEAVQLAVCSAHWWIDWPTDCSLFCNYQSFSMPLQTSNSAKWNDNINYFHNFIFLFVILLTCMCSFAFYFYFHFDLYVITFLYSFCPC